MMNNKAIELLKEVLGLLEPEEVKPTLDEIVSSGMVKMAEAVEAVIARHEGEIKNIYVHSWVEGAGDWL